MNFIKELNNINDFKDISFDEQATTIEGKKAKEVFCNGWPSSRIVLEAIASMVKNPIAKVIIGIVIKAGDALSAKICA